MSKLSPLSLALLLALAVSAAQAQRGGGGGGGGKGGPVPDPVHAPDTGPANPQPKSDAERAAIVDLHKVFADPATTPAQMDAAIQAFITGYPKSDFVFSVDSLGVEYFANDAHADPAKTFAYANAALKLLPTDLRTLYNAVNGISKHESATNPNLEATLKLATEWDDRLIAQVKLIPDTSGRGRGDASADPEAAKQRAAKAKQDKDQLLYSGYLALGRIATLRKNPQEVGAAFDKALAVADWDPAHTDLNRGETYLALAQARESLQQWPEAAAALDQANKVAPGSPILQQEIADEQTKLKAH